MEDTELLVLMPFLKSIAETMSDVRDELRKVLEDDN